MIIKSISAAPEYIKVSKGSALPITVTATYMDEHTETVTGWTSNYKSDQLGNQLVTVTYQGKITYVSVTVTSKLICPVCGTEYNPNPDGSNPGCPVCSKFIESITATPATQVVSFGEELKLQVEATFRNGNHAYVNDWSSDFNPFKIGTQNVTVIYGTVSTTVTAIVKSASQTTCPICGTTYNPIIYPNGCPICSNLITGITAKLKNGGTKVQFGSELDLAIILAYRDGHRVVTYNGWSVSGYQPYVLGNQNITVTYKEFRTTLAIEVVNTLSKKVCPNGHVYYLNEDGTDPGCPYCSDSKESNYSQNYKDCIYTDIILEVLYSTGIYYFNDGDGFTITVTQRPGSILGKLQNMFTQTTDADIKYSYGGIVHG
jgi:rubrerythrin